ncbi:MAG: flippase-like domain-containing protein [Actinobacteria bacterium]|nr:flippase-like domain-containing protein [Actinomycetota bacterium]
MSPSSERPAQQPEPGEESQPDAPAMDVGGAAAAEPAATSDSTESGGTAANGDAPSADEQARAHLGASSGLDKKRTIIGGIIAVIFLAIVFWRVIPQIGDYSAAVESLQAMTIWSLIALIVAVVIYNFIYGWPFVAAVPGLKYRQGFVVNESAFLVSNGIPGGGAFGLGLQYAQLTSYKATPTAATAGIGATGVWSIFVTLGLPTTGIAALALSGDDASGYIWAAIIAIGILAAVIGLFALILWSEKFAVKLGHFGNRLVNPILARFKKHDWQVHLEDTILDLRNDIVDLVKRRWIVITISQIGVSWSQFAILYVALLAVSGDNTISLLAAYGSWAVSQIGIMIPITPGGLGTVDAALIGLLQAAGADVGDATAAALVWRASSYVPQMAIGLGCIFFWRWEEARRRKAEADEAGTAQPAT